MLKRGAHLHWMLMPVFVVACGPNEDIEEADTETLCPIFGCGGEDDPGENGIDDVPNTFGSARILPLGSTFTDEINSNTDTDYFKFYQNAGSLTRVSVTGANCWLYKKVGFNYVPAPYTDTNQSSTICFIQFVPTEARYWWIKVQRTDGVWGNAATTGATKPCPSQPHSMFEEGPPLDGGGSNECCVPLVCGTDSYCCSNWWDGQCVQEVHDWCGL